MLDGENSLEACLTSLKSLKIRFDLDSGEIRIVKNLEKKKAKIGICESEEAESERSENLYKSSLDEENR